MLRRNWLKATHDGGMGRWSAIYATMNPQGHIFLTRHTWKKLGQPKAFHMLYDKANATIGMKPADERARNVYLALSRSGHGGRVIRAFSFMQQFGIRLNETVRFTAAEIDDEGVLILDLRKVRSAAKPKRKC